MNCCPQFRNSPTANSPPPDPPRLSVQAVPQILHPQILRDYQFKLYRKSSWKRAQVSIAYIQGLHENIAFCEENVSAWKHNSGSRPIVLADVVTKDPDWIALHGAEHGLTSYTPPLGKQGGTTPLSVASASSSSQGSSGGGKKGNMNMGGGGGWGKPGGWGNPGGWGKSKGGDQEGRSWGTVGEKGRIPSVEGGFRNSGGGKSSSYIGLPPGLEER